MPDPDQTESQDTGIKAALSRFFNTYFKRGTAAGVGAGVLFGSTCAQGAVWGGVLGAPFGGVGAVPGAVIGGVAGVVVGGSTGAAVGGFADYAGDKKVAAIAATQARQQDQIDNLTDRYDKLQARNQHLLARLEAALDDINSCPSTTHTVRHTPSNNIDDRFVCAITQQVLNDPITAIWQENGRTVSKTYEREALVLWRESCETNGRAFTDPQTRKVITIDPSTHPTDEAKLAEVQAFLVSNPEHYSAQFEASSSVGSAPARLTGRG